MVPWISLSLLASIVANLISLFATYQVFQVFPFDFADYDSSWTVVTRSGNCWPLEEYLSVVFDSNAAWQILDAITHAMNAEDDLAKVGGDAE